jgi:hypothetical protein
VCEHAECREPITEEALYARPGEPVFISPQFEALALAAALRIVRRETRLRIGEIADALNVRRQKVYRLSEGRVSRVRWTRDYLWERLAELRQRARFLTCE